MILVECKLALSQRNTTLFLLTSVGHFLDDFHAHVAAVESISLHWVSDCGLKTQNEWYHSDPTIHTA